MGKVPEKRKLRDLVREGAFHLFLFLSGYIFLLPLLFLVVTCNEIVRWFIDEFLNEGTPIQLATGGRKTLPFTGEKEGRGAGLCVLASDPEDKFDLEGEISWMKKRLGNMKGFEDLKSTFTTRFGYCAMKRMKDFDLRRHISVWDSGDRTVTEEELLLNVIPSLIHPFECETKPPWEWIVIPKVIFQGKLQTIRLLRMHWAYGDGFSIFALLSTLLEFKGKEPPFIFNPWKKLGTGEKFKISMLWTKALLKLPYELAKVLFWDDEYLLGEKDPFSGSAEAQPLSSYRYCISPELPVSFLKDVAKGAKVDTTSTFITAYRNALARVCQEDDLSDQDATFAYCTSLLLPCQRAWGFQNQTFEIEEEVPLYNRDWVTGKKVGERWAGIWWRILENWLDRMPCFVVQWFLRSEYYEGVKVSTYLANAPFTKEKGSWRRKRVNCVGFFEADGAPLCMTGIGCSYGDGFRVFSATNSTLHIANKMNTVFRYVEEELKTAFRVPEASGHNGLGRREVLGRDVFGKAG